MESLVDTNPERHFGNEFSKNIAKTQFLLLEVRNLWNLVTNTLIFNARFGMLLCEKQMQPRLVAPIRLMWLVLFFIEQKQNCSVC
ncbi:hypothetical protein LINPERHAP2_LOCUS33420 [Linum perenne]